MKQLFYTGTRDRALHVSSSEAILAGLAPDGGLFVPEYFPELDVSLADLSQMDYRECAYQVMKLFLQDFTEEELRSCIRGAYDEKFDTKEIAVLKQAAGAWYLELFHGATIAFKDMALSILPYLMRTAARKHGVEDEIVILTATSGDTGKAALAGFADVPGTKIIVFYPKYGVSDIQERQMVTQKGGNVAVFGITGNFDDAQTSVKKLFTDPALREKLQQNGFRFSSANSINIGRLVPQVAYYAYAYGQLMKQNAIAEGEEINVTVPTGNFGNILAAYYAKQIGIPIRKLICASNENKVLFDFFQTGNYNRKREFVLTTSPSMDILVSSNLERLIYEIAGKDADTCKALMHQLSTEGLYDITDEMRSGLKDFYGNSANVDETAGEIRRVFEETGYVLDPHTSVASCVYGKYVQETGDLTPTVIASTASPYKFTASVMEALGNEAGADAFALADRLSEMTGTAIPKAVEEIRTAPVLHTRVVEKEEMEQAVLDFLGLQ